MYVILVYDIKLDETGAKVLRNVFKTCKKYLSHIQNSTFEGEINISSLNKLQFELYKWIINLEFGFLGLPDPDLKILLHMPYEYSNILKKNRKEKPDQHEKSESHLKNAEKSYLEIAKLYNFN